MTLTPVFIVAGVGAGGGTGAATARLFAKAGYSIALIARNPSSLKSLADEINNTNANQADHFPVDNYSPQSIESAFTRIRTRFPSPSFSIRAALFNVGSSTWGPFLSLTPDQIRDSIDSTVLAAFAFSREALLQFKSNEIDERGESLGGKGKRGTLLFTGATASLRGNVTTSVFAAAKHGVRGLSQSLAKEFGKENIHVAHVIIDGGIATVQAQSRATGDDQNRRLNPDSIANAYLYLAKQDSSAMTWELDLRPAHEKW